MDPRESGATHTIHRPGTGSVVGAKGPAGRSGPARIACAAGCAALLSSALATAADHRDSPSLDPLDTTSPTANPNADLREDINDIYAFMNPNDAEELILVMTVFRDATPDTTFSTTITHDFLFESYTSPTSPFDNLRLSCVFPSVTEVSCSLGDRTVTGQVGQTGTADGLRVYTGLREDPFFFNGPGVNMMLPEGDEFATMLPADATARLQAAVDANGGVADDFAGENTLAIVIGVDRDLLTADQAAPILRIWAATAPR